jgi:hypothetical protein
MVGGFQPLIPVGRASSPSINGTGNPAFGAGRRHQIPLLFAIAFQNPYIAAASRASALIFNLQSWCFPKAVGQWRSHYSSLSEPWTLSLPLK